MSCVVCSLPGGPIWRLCASIMSFVNEGKVKTETLETAALGLQAVETALFEAQRAEEIERENRRRQKQQRRDARAIIDQQLAELQAQKEALVISSDDSDADNAESIKVSTNDAVSGSGTGSSSLTTSANHTTAHAKPAPTMPTGAADPLVGGVPLTGEDEVQPPDIDFSSQESGNDGGIGNPDGVGTWQRTKLQAVLEAVPKRKASDLVSQAAGSAAHANVDHHANDDRVDKITCGNCRRNGKMCSGYVQGQRCDACVLKHLNSAVGDEPIECKPATSADQKGSHKAKAMGGGDGGGMKRARKSSGVGGGDGSVVKKVVGGAKRARGVDGGGVAKAHMGSGVEVYDMIASDTIDGTLSPIDWLKFVNSPEWRQVKPGAYVQAKGLTVEPDRVFSLTVNRFEAITPRLGDVVSSVWDELGSTIWHEEHPNEEQPPFTKCSPAYMCLKEKGGSGFYGAFVIGICAARDNGEQQWLAVTAIVDKKIIDALIGDGDDAIDTEACTALLLQLYKHGELLLVSETQKNTGINKVETRHIEHMQWVTNVCLVSPVCHALHACYCDYCSVV